jgi:hypothetical protein
MSRYSNETNSVERAVDDMLATMEKFSDDLLTDGRSREDVARAWVDDGFAADSVGLWWLGGCFDSGRTAELRDAGVDPRDIARKCALGDSIGYHHSNYDLSMSDVLVLIDGMV